MSTRSFFALTLLVSASLLLTHCAEDVPEDEGMGGTGNGMAGSSGSSGSNAGSAGSSSGAGSGGTGGGVTAGTSGGGTGPAGASGSSAGLGGTGGGAGASAGGTTGGAGSGSSGAGAGGGAGTGGALGGAGSGGTGAGSGGTGGGGEFVLTSSKLVPGAEMPADFTCEGDAHSPPLEWTGAPAGTMSFAMLFVNTTIAGPMPDSGMAWHHAIWDIPASVTGLPEDMPTTATVTTPVMCKQFNPLGCEGYLGPCAQKEDTYEFRLYALPVATLTGTLNSVVAIRDAIMAANPLDDAVLAVSANASGTLSCPK